MGMLELLGGEGMRWMFCDCGLGFEGWSLVGSFVLKAGVVGIVYFCIRRRYKRCDAYIHT